MPSITLTGNVYSTKQGWYSSSGAKTGTSAVLKIDFTGSKQTYITSLDIDNITITNPRLNINCSSSGASRRKYFNLDFRYQLGNAVLQTASEAYNSSTYINLSSQIELFKKWLKGGTHIFSTDPESNSYFKGGGSSTYSYNFVNVTAATITFDYTINKNSLTNPPQQLTMGATQTLTWNNPNSYTSKITLKVGNRTQNIYNGNGTQISFTTSRTFANEIPSAKETSGVLTIETFNGDTSIGSNNYDVTLIISSNDTNFAPTCTKTIGGKTTFNAQDGAQQVILTNYTNLICSCTATPKYGATITNYSWSFPDSTAIGGQEVSKIFTSEVTGSIILTITDSRGFTCSSSESITVFPYTPPIINSLSAYRVASPTDTVRDDAGTYVRISYLIDYTQKINNKSNNLALVYELDGTSVTLNENRVLSKTISPSVLGKFSIKATDKIGNYDTEICDVSSMNYLLHFLKNQNAVGIGSAAVAPTNTESGKITMGWPVDFKDSITLEAPLPVSSGGTGYNSPTSFFNAYLKSLILDTFYPVGSIYMSTSPQNPQALFGGGIWEPWGAGRVPVGVDASNANYDTSNEVGGQATHTHKYGLKFGAYYGDTVIERITENGELVTGAINYPSATTEKPYPVGEYEEIKQLTGAVNSNSGTTWKNQTLTLAKSEAQTSDTSNMPPYITCYMWRRTA